MPRASPSSPSESGGCVGEAAVELGGGLAAAVAVGAQPGRRAASPTARRRGRRTGTVPGTAARSGCRCREQADGAGEHDAQVGAQLVGDRDPVLDEVLAGPDVAAQRDRGRRVGLEAAPAVPVGAQAVGEHVGVGAVGLVARGAVALTQRLDRPGRHDHDLEAGIEQGVDDRAVGSFDRDAPCTGALHASAQLAQPVGAVGDVELDDHPAVAVDDAHRVRVDGPVDTGVADGGIMHLSLLAVTAVGKHPVVSGRVCRSLTDRRSGALSPIASRHVLGHRTSQNSSWRSSRKRRMAMARWDPRVRQQPRRRHRHGAPVSERVFERANHQARSSAHWCAAERSEPSDIANAHQ